MASYSNFSAVIWLNILAVFLITCGFMMSSFFTLFLHGRGIAINTIAYILAVGGIGAMSGSYLSGILITKKPARRCNFIQVALLGFAAIIATFPCVHSLNLYFALNCAANFCYGLFRPINQSFLFTHAAPADHPRVMALYRVAYNLGLAVATCTGGFLAAIDFSWMFLFSSFMCLSGAAVYYFSRQRLQIPPPIHYAATKHPSAKMAPASAFSKRAYIYLCLLFFIYNLLFFQTNSTYGLYLQQVYQLNLQQFGLLFVLNFLLIILVEVPLMARLKHSSQTYLAMYGSVFMGLGLCILPFSHSYAIAWLSVLLWSCGEILATSPFFVLALRFANPKATGLYLGIFQSILSLALIFAPIGGSILYSYQQSYFLWLICGIIPLLMIWGFLRLQSYERKPSSC